MDRTLDREPRRCQPLRVKRVLVPFARPNQNRMRRGGVLAVLSLLFFFSGCGGLATPTTPPPDVILITLDTTRMDRIGSYGFEDETTPYLDSLAKSGIRFRRAWSTASWTLPAHASFLTGKYPHRHGAHFCGKEGGVGLDQVVGEIGERFQVGRLPEHEITLAEMLAEKGYKTAAFVGGPWLTPPFGLLQGYEVQDAGISTLGGREAGEISAAANAWIASVPRNRPIHLMLNYFDPHDPYAPPREYRSTESGLAGIDREIALYEGEIRYMDWQIGKVFDALRAADRFEGALIVVVSDHGELFQEHGLTKHGYWLYEDLIRIPLVVRFPGGARAGEVVDEVFSGVDLLPLIARETGLTLPNDIDGVEVGDRLVAVSEFHQNPTIKEVRGTQVDRDLVAVMRWPWKLIISSGGESELYRLDIDPEEKDALTNAFEQECMDDLLPIAAAVFKESTKSVPAEEVSDEVRALLKKLGYVQ